MRPVLALAVVAVAVGSGASASQSESPSRCVTDSRALAPTASARFPARKLVFGIYPGGRAGAVGPVGRTVAEDRTKRLAALQRLRAPGRPFVLHLYASYTGPRSPSPFELVGAEIAAYTAAGFQIELVLTYRPAEPDPESTPQGFAEFARTAVRTLGANRSLVALQVTNEANVRDAPDAADGAYAGVSEALVRGVIAAKDEARRNGFGQLTIGFNWAYALDASQVAFWRGLGRSGGDRFRDALDWVGLDLYPGTWGPRACGDLAAETRTTVLWALAGIRTHYMPLAGIRKEIPLRIAESGYPTGPGRTEAMQQAVLRTVVTTVDAYRSSFNVTDYRWFALRDADSASSSFESRYGLMDHDYAPKAAFDTYRNLVATLGA
jgi:hypothetical protein